jgi:hypothetical protein
MRTGNKIALTRLYRKVSAHSGEQYFVGRLGAARMLLFKDRDQPAEGDEVFSLLIEPVEDQATAPKTRPPPPPRNRPVKTAPDLEQDDLADMIVGG